MTTADFSYVEGLRRQDATWREFLRLTPTAALIRLDDLQLLPSGSALQLHEHIARLYSGSDSALFRDWKQDHRESTS